MNYNEEYTIREVFEKDFFEGMLVQSFGNELCIYTIGKIYDKWHFCTNYKIIDKKNFIFEMWRPNGGWVPMDNHPH